jgi:hypothetical protein
MSNLNILRIALCLQEAEALFQKRYAEVTASDKVVAA